MAQVVDRNFTKKLNEGASVFIEGFIRGRLLDSQDRKRAALKEQIRLLKEEEVSLGQSIVESKEFLKENNDAIEALAKELSEISESGVSDSRETIKNMANLLIQSGAAKIPDFDADEGPGAGDVKPKRRVPRKRRGQDEIAGAPEGSDTASPAGINPENPATITLPEKEKEAEILAKAGKIVMHNAGDNQEEKDKGAGSVLETPDHSDEYNDSLDALVKDKVSSVETGPVFEPETATGTSSAETSAPATEAEGTEDTVSEKSNARPPQPFRRVVVSNSPDRGE